MANISVIIPMFNAEATICRALESVKNQKYGGSFEILVVNDGSTDQSAAVVEAYRAQNPQMNIVLIQQQNQGVSAARNTAMKVATGDYLALLDADDEWLPAKTAKQMAFLENEDIDFITSLWNDERIVFPYSIDKQRGLVEINLKKLLLKITGQTSTAIFKRKILSNTGCFDPAQRYAEDANFWMRISAHNKMYLLPESLVLAGSGKKSFGVSGLSADLVEMEKGIQKNIREMYQDRRINFMEYQIYFVFSKLKYWIRPLRAKL